MRTNKSSISIVIVLIAAILLLGLIIHSSNSQGNTYGNVDKQDLTTEDVRKSVDKRYEGQIYYKDRPFTGIFYSKDKKCCWNVSNGFAEKLSIKDIEGDINAEMVFEQYNGFISVYHPNNVKAIEMKVQLAKGQAITVKYYNTSGLAISERDFRELCPRPWKVCKKIIAIKEKYEKEIKEKEDKSWW